MKWNENRFIQDLYSAKRIHFLYPVRWGSTWRLMVNVLDNDVKICEFKLQLNYYVHFWTNTVGKGMNPSYPLSYGLNSITAAILYGWVWH